MICRKENSMKECPNTDSGLYQEYRFVIFARGTYDFRYCTFAELRKKYGQMKKKYPQSGITVRRYKSVLNVDKQIELRGNKQ